MDNATLLQKVRQHEPVMHFRTGELFFPMRVDEYIAKCSLHEWIGGNDHSLVLPPGQLSVENLQEYISNIHFMVYADQESYVQVLPTVSAHLANFRVVPETIEALRKLSAKVTKGKLPKRIIEVAQENYGGLDHNPPTYYYRTISKQESGEKYDVIQYWFFYAFNDWATTFDGVNDHEADWEKIQLVFNSFEDDYPLYAIYSAHDGFFTRNWDALDKDDTGNHPVVYVQGGSHAAFPSRYLGSFDYLIRSTVKNPFGLFKYLSEFVEAGGEVWNEGDISIGNGGDHGWAEPLNLHEQTWVPTYRGLWGTRYYVKELGRRRKVPKGGGAPAGPMFDTDGFVRTSWETPVKWSELD